MPRALISVYDKHNLKHLAEQLIALGWEIVASGGTERDLRAHGLPVTPVQQLTGMDAMLGGRVKTLHPAIHAPILMRDKPEDVEEIQRLGYAPIAMVVCNLYPFQNTIAQANVSLQDAIEQIDIGGVTLLRAAAKNFLRVTVITDPADYERVIHALREEGSTSLVLRRELAVKAFAHTRDYDTAVHAYLSRDVVTPIDPNSALPDQVSLAFYRAEDLRYGENPHQRGAFYSPNRFGTPLGGQLVGGKQLSYNNILDLDSAWRAVSSFDEPTVVIVKHLTPIGIASAATLAEAYPQALEADPVSAFGGVIAVNEIVDKAFVQALGMLFIEAIAAPAFQPEAHEMLLASRRNCRLLRIPHTYDGNHLELRSVHRGILAQRPDMGDPEGTALTVVTERAPSPEELSALQYAWRAVQHVKSNAIVLAKPGHIVGVGGGLPSRLDAVELALKKAGSRAAGAVMASDAFFPFPDGVEAAIHAGVTAIIQPGGSIRDNQVIEAANQANVAMVFTNVRHFRH
ncbi:MAG: bifunctional phosphoribosylaminoimidazolecarboxamide formyltransferase/IMP cyclohydrolase [Anaerolineae bacterium]|nr:bifunctional phosphoribosylaminoimidazolecarboxamide formyltransferase/IMP cyclohydrolase [Anaerolineae bacterium]MDW8173276.1 bifunctional phosphoribosylaminoimidazolecarboxamide formyltransferase/IMP cyclohydrolase [Anaerolineae bacterium]